VQHKQLLREKGGRAVCQRWEPPLQHPGWAPNVVPIRQPRPDSGLGFQVKVLKIFPVVPSSLG